MEFNILGKILPFYRESHRTLQDNDLVYSESDKMQIGGQEPDENDEQLNGEMEEEVEDSDGKSEEETDSDQSLGR
jgi:hypothetical protein